MPRDPTPRSSHHAATHHHHTHYQQQAQYPPTPPPLSIAQTMANGSANGNGGPPIMKAFPVQQSPASATVPNGASNSPLASPQLTRGSEHPHHYLQNGGSMAPPPPSSTSSSPTSPQSSLTSPTAPPSSATSVSSAASSTVNGGGTAGGSAGPSPTPAGQKKKHVCPTCERAFTTSGHLARHTRVHTGERNHKCPFPGCDTRCSRQDTCNSST